MDPTNKLEHGKDSPYGDKLSELIKEFSELKDVHIKQGLSEKHLHEIFMHHIRSPSDLPSNIKEPSKAWKNFWRLVLFVCLPLLLAFLGHCYLNEDSFLYGENGFFAYIHDTKCLLDSGGLSSEFFRPVANCQMCNHLKEVPVVNDISKERFVSKFAYSGMPLLVKHATDGWTAIDTFSYPYFKKLYTTTPDALELTERECQFFPYDTDFISLADAFNMSDARAAFKPNEKHWYFGWSNCQADIARELRRHYRKPHFLPAESESSALDWIFMGGPGRGAYIHLDSVQRPSWQAQISGRKTWMLFPPPECEHICHPINATMEKGDMIVVDTNLWYHSTFIHPGELSITIGSEYD